MADVMVALDRADLPPEAIDTAVRALTDEGVDVLDVPVEDDTFSEAEIRQAMNFHLCRCGTYNRIVQAIQLAATRMGEPT